MIIVTSAMHSQQGEWERSNRWQVWVKPKKVTNHYSKPTLFHTMWTEALLLMKRIFLGLLPKHGVFFVV